MRAPAIGTLLVVLFLGGAVVVQAQTPDVADQKSSWLPSWLPFGKKSDSSKAVPAPQGEVVTEPAAVIRARERKALARRLAVCDRLMEIAENNHDEQLRRKAEQLHQRVMSLWDEHTAPLSGDRGGSFESDQQIIDRHLGGSSLSEQTSSLTRSPLDSGSGSAARREAP
jgi:hypothetical protein